MAGSLLLLGACASTPLSQYFETPYFDAPPAQTTRADRELFERALFRQKNNRIQAAIKVWNQFLQKQPRSYEAHNNLGLVYFENDQLDPALVEFETARSLEPGDARIKNNLIRVLKFKATLLKEAKDFNGAVDYLMRAQEISAPREKEQIGFLIEEMEDKVFEQVQKVNTLEAYEGFLKRYPNSPKNSAEARNRIEGLKPRDLAAMSPEGQDAGTGEPASGTGGEADLKENDGAMEKMGAKSTDAKESMMESPAMDAMDEKSMSRDGSMMMKDKAMAGENKSMQGMKKEFIPEQPGEAVRLSPRQIEIATQPEPKPSTSSSLQPKQAVSPGAKPAMEQPQSGLKVEIVTQKDPLRVREGPFFGAKVITSVEKGTRVPLIQEKDGWYKIEFGEGQTGWIVKKYAQRVE